MLHSIKFKPNLIANRGLDSTHRVAVFSPQFRRRQNHSRIVMILSVLIYLLLTGCEGNHYPITSTIQSGVKGKAGEHTPIVRDTEGNLFGYYEYLPLNFSPDQGRLPLVFYWNGANAISGDGKTDLPGLLNQGLAQYIDQGQHFPAIIITAQLHYNDWKTIDIDPFITYILKRYQDVIDRQRVYMTGFSAGGGLTMRYAIEHGNKLAAIMPVAPAIFFPQAETDLSKISRLPSWIFHNEGDEVVSHDRSLAWHDVLKNSNDQQHRLTIYPVEGHYAWQTVYSDANALAWLFAQINSNPPSLESRE